MTAWAMLTQLAEVILLASAVLSVMVAVLSTKFLILRDASRLWRYAGSTLVTSMAATVAFIMVTGPRTPALLQLSLFYVFYLGSVLLALAIVNELRAQDIEPFLP